MVKTLESRLKTLETELEKCDNLKKYCHGDFNYKFLIESGSHGRKIYYGQHKISKVPTAVKIIPNESLGPERYQQIYNEITLLSTLQNNPRIVQILGYSLDLEKTHIYLEYTHQGDLFEYYCDPAHRIGLKQIKKDLIVIAQAIQECHNHGILHLDVKLENILIFDGRVLKLTDFNLSSKYKMKIKGIVGTSQCISPEMLKGEEIGYETDIWSLGILIYELVCGDNPFYVSNEEDDDADGLKIKKKILKLDYIFPPLVSEEFQRLLRHILRDLPTERPSIDWILSQEWFYHDNK